MRFIGSKVNLLNEIDNFVNKNIPNVSEDMIFLDLFAGTNSVGNHFKNGFTIYSNDFLYFSYLNALAIIENNEELKFKNLKSLGIDSPLDYLEDEANKYLESSDIGYYEVNYSPTGGVMYFSVENAKRIDYIRNQIDRWRDDGLLTKVEYAYLVSVLIEAIPGISNTTGTYGAFLKHWDNRALKPLELIPIVIKNNGRCNRSFNEDSNELIKRLKVDIAYIDTPYNGRQYASNYHVLENIAKNQKFELKGVTRLFDWSDQRSDFSSKTKALVAMDDLLKNINADHVIISYNNEGIIPEKELMFLAEKYSCDGKVKLEKKPYRKYKSKVASETYDLYELLIYFSKNMNSKSTRTIKSKKTSATTEWKCKKNTYIKGPLNYIGGKYKLLDQILPLFPKNINTFVDLFSGGANVGINVNANHHIFNDMNHRINEMFRYFADQNVDELISDIYSRIEESGLSKTNEAAYLKFRKNYNRNPNPLDLYVLSSFSYNYQFRFNNSMQFNNPFGKNRSSFSVNMEKNLRRFVTKLQSLNAVFTDFYFEEFDYSFLTSNDFVYLDPPYLITTGSYNDGNRGFKDWNINEEKKMYSLLQSLTRKKVRYALSNVIEHKGNTNKLLDEFISSEPVRVHCLDFNYNNSSHNSKKKGSKEVLITNF